jgi:hypothetical protein
MRIVILYRPQSEHARVVEEFIQNYRDHHSSGRLDVLNVDSREGSDMISLYDIMQYPTILALSNDGSVLHTWEGDMLPLQDEVAAYAYSGGDSFAPGSSPEL